MSRRKGSSIKRLFCSRNRQDEGDVYGKNLSANNEKVQTETELLKAMVENFEGKLDRLLMSSDRERQLTDLIKEKGEGLKAENGDLKQENKRLESINRESEKQLVLAESNYRALTTKHSFATEMLEMLNKRVKDLTEIIDKHKEEKADLQGELKVLKDTTNSLKSQLAMLDDGKVMCESQQEELIREKRQLQTLLVKQNEVNQNRLRSAWMRFHQMKEERDELAAQFSAQSSRTRTPQFMAALPDTSKLDHGSNIVSGKSPEQMIFETRIMKLEMTLFRRNKLIEILTERLKTHIPEFSLFHDPEVAAYIDDDLMRDVQFSDWDVDSQVSSDSQLTL